MEDKFHLSREESILIAKKYLKESVYRSAHLEGIQVTFPQTEAILEDAMVQNVTSKDICKICDLRDAWEYLLLHLDEPLDLVFLENIHEIIAKEDLPWNYLGKIRDIVVRISGTSFMPEIPSSEEIHKSLINLLSISNATERAIETLLYLMRLQPFVDGNKRVATFACNKILIENGCGIFSVPVEYTQTFSEKLVHYYTTNESSDLKQFIYDYCIDGITFSS